MANYYVSPADYLLVAQYANTTAYTVGQIIRQLAAPALGSERCFRCSTAGTTGGSEPAWNLGANATTNSGTAVFTECTGQEAYNAAWEAPAALTSLYMAQTTGRATIADSVFIREGGTETYTANQTWTQTANMVAVVVTASAIPPVTADLATSPLATIATSGAVSITLSNGTRYSGIAWKLGTGASTANLNCGAFSGGGPMNLKDCSVELVGTSASSVWNWSANSSSNVPAYLFDGVTFKVNSTSQKISMATDADVMWINTPSAIQGATLPTTLFSVTGGHQVITVDGVDLSALTGTIVQLGTGSTQTKFTANFSNCKLNASVTLFGGTSQLYPYGAFFNFDNCSDGTSTFQMARATNGGNGTGINTSGLIARAGGASNGVSNFSWRSNISVGGQATLQKWAPWVSPWMAIWNTTTGAAVTLTVHTLSALATAPTDAVLFLEAKALTDSASPLAEWFTTQLDFLPSSSATTLTADTGSDWGAGTVAARANSTAYSASPADYIENPSQVGMILICTTGGTSAGSVPAGYGTVVDGGSVTDGTAVFRALWRQEMSISFTPELVGLMYVRVGFYERTNAGPIYIDPLPVVS